MMSCPVRQRGCQNLCGTPLACSFRTLTRTAALVCPQGCDALICMPTTCPQIKVDAVRALGGTVHLHGESYTETQAYAQVCRFKDVKSLTPIARPRSSTSPERCNGSRHL